MTISYHRLLVIRFLCFFGAFCILGLWVYEFSARILTAYDRYAYPALLTAILVALLLSFKGPKAQKFAEFIGLSSISVYFLGATLKFFVTPDVTLYIVANTMQWLGVIIVAFFVVFTGSYAIWLATSLLFLIYAPLFLRMTLSGSEFWEPEVVPIIFNSFSIDVAILIALTTIQKLRVSLLQSDLSLEQITEIAHFDNLTGVRTRAGFQVYLEQAELKSDYSTHWILFIVDLDNLKLVNDTRGHDQGDVALSTLARALEKAVPEHACIARWGGDEFLVAIQREDRRSLSELVSHVHDVVNDAVQAVSSITSVSIGGVEWDRSSQSFEACFRSADVALYQAKFAGKATFVTV